MQLKKREKILIYTENYEVGGGNRYLVDIINSIPMSYEVVVASNLGGIFKVDFGKIVREYTYTSVNVLSIVRLDRFPIAIILKRLKIWRAVRLFLSRLLPCYARHANATKFLQLLDDVKPDLVISCNGGYPAALSCLDLVNTCTRLKIASILTIVSMPTKNLFIDWFYPSKNLMNQRIIVNAQAIKTALIEQKELSGERINVIHNSVEAIPAVIHHGPRDEEIVVFGYVGRIEQMKGIWCLLNSFAKIATRCPNAILILVGGGDIDSAKCLAGKLGILERVKFTGYVDNNIYDVLEKIDIFVFPSLWEGLPYSILEAMNAGKLIISTNVGGIPEIIMHKHNGILVCPGDENSLCLAMFDAYDKFDKYHSFRVQAKSTIENNFVFEIFRSKIQEVLLV